ncbi:MAG: hypothetical protein ACXW0Z_21145 [Gemmatirosa sp.]
MHSPPFRATVAVALAILLLSACGGAAADDAPATASAPARAGEVWELDSADSRASAPAALQAYVHGLHVMVVDDETAYAGMTRLTGREAAEGGRTYHLADGTEARLAPAGDAMELRFAGGAAVHLRRQPAREPAHEPARERR